MRDAQGAVGGLDVNYSIAMHHNVEIDNTRAVTHSSIPKQPSHVLLNALELGQKSRGRQRSAKCLVQQGARAETVIRWYDMHEDSRMIQP